MKKCLVMLLAAALFVVAGCKKDDNNAKKMTFTSDFGGGAKTEINDIDKTMTWSEGDKININGEEFSSEIKDEGKRAEFTGKVVQPTYKAVYPASIYQDGRYVLPETQTYNSTNLSLVSPMYAESETTSLVFHNICALVKLNLKGTGTVKTITASADQPLCGEFTIQGNETEGYYAAITPTRDGAATVTLNCGDGVALTADAKAFYIALPQGEYDNLKFTVSNGTVTKEVTIAETNLVAGTLYAEEKEVELDAPVIPEGALSGLFSISDNQQVYFSEGNLQAKYNSSSSSYTWQFAATQYEVIGNNAGNTTIGSSQGDGKVVDLFGWSTDATNNNYGIHKQVSNSTTYTGGDFKDWGIAYCQSNNIANTDTWYTLTGNTGGEWDYLLNQRSGNKAPDIDVNNVVKTDCRYSILYVNGILGCLVYPDNFTWPSQVTNYPTYFNSKSQNTTNYDLEEFGHLQDAGAVFLPCAGYRSGSTISQYPGSSNVRGRYQSSTTNGDKEAYNFYIMNSNSFGPANSDYRYFGFSVRLVTNK